MICIIRSCFYIHSTKDGLRCPHNVIVYCSSWRTTPEMDRMFLNGTSHGYGVKCGGERLDLEVLIFKVAN